MVELHEARSDRDQPRDDVADRSPQVLDLEARLIDRARRGDIQAWSRLYQEHFDRVFRHLHHLTGDRDLMRSLIETRRVIEPAAAGMAAARASAAPPRPRGARAPGAGPRSSWAGSAC